MNEYIKLEDAIERVSWFIKDSEEKEDVVLVDVPSGYERIEDYVDDLLSECPTIEASEDCISRSALMEQFDSGWIGKNDSFPCYKVVDTIENSPSVLPIRPSGEWVRPNDTVRGSYKFQCSVCGNIAHQVTGYCGKRNKQSAENKCTYNYCPNCGADMRGNDNDSL